MCSSKKREETQKGKYSRKGPSTQEREKESLRMTVLRSQPQRITREKPGHMGAGLWGLCDGSESNRCPEEAEHRVRSSGRIWE